MAFSDLTIVKYYDRVRDFSFTSGTGTITLEGSPPTGYRGFDTLADGERCHYVILDTDGSWALYRGQFSATAVSLSKITLLASSSGTDIDFSAERKEVFLVAAGTTYEETITEVARLGALAATALPFPISSGGTSATSASGARTALGLAIGADVQAWDAQLDSYAAFAGAASQITYFQSASVISGFDSNSFSRSFMAASSAAAAIAILGGLSASDIGVTVQAWDTVLDGFAALSTASTIPYFSAASTVSSFASAAYGRSLVSASDAAAALALISTPLTTIAGFSAGGFLVNTGASTWALRTLTGASGVAISAGSATAANPEITLNVNGLTAATTAATTADKIPIYGNVPTAHRSLTLQNALAVLLQLTTDAAPDTTNDWMLTYDVSASQVKKVNPSSIGSFTPATQAQQEAASASTVAVTPLNFKWHPGAVKVVGLASVSGATPTLQTPPSFGMGSISDDAVGKLGVTMSPGFSSTNYCTIITISADSLSRRMTGITASTVTSTFFQIQSYSTSGTLNDPDWWSWMCAGDYA